MSLGKAPGEHRIFGGDVAVADGVNQAAEPSFGGDALLANTTAIVLQAETRFF